MKLSDISPLSALKTVLVSAGVDCVIYEGSKPTSGLPDSYIELIQNGSLKSETENVSIVNGVALISINVKLLSTMAVNTKKETLILKKFEDLFFNGKTATSGSYRFSLDKDNMVYSGRGLSEGYSSKVINLVFKTF
jgi:hypothetical protein